MERNQQWAKTAYALGFSTGKKTFSHSGAPNRFGAARCRRGHGQPGDRGDGAGPAGHFMGGFDAQRARAEFHVPDDFEIGAAFAIGYIDETAAVPIARTRKGLEEIVFAGDWGVPALE